MSEGPFSLAGRRVLVTGASSGIGRAAATAAAAAGARVLATGRDAGRLDEAVAALPGTGHARVAADLTTAAGRATVVAEADGLDGLVHAAGAVALTPFKYVEVEELEGLQAINYEAPFVLTRDLVRGRRIAEGGSIVFVASVAPRLGSVGHAAYAASKAALVAAAQVMARELSVRRVRVNCLCPATVKTPLLDRLAAGALAERAADETRYPLGYGEPEDVAHAAVFLLAPASRWITGTSITLDGGLLL